MLIFLFTLFLLFTIVPLILRLVLLVFVNKTKKRYSNTEQHDNYSGRGYSEKKEGEVFVSSSSVEKDKVVEKDMGEYVDFETVKED